MVWLHFDVCSLTRNHVLWFKTWDQQSKSGSVELRGNWTGVLYYVIHGRWSHDDDDDNNDDDDGGEDDDDDDVDEDGDKEGGDDDEDWKKMLISVAPLFGRRFKSGGFVPWQWSVYKMSPREILVTMIT